MQAYVVRSAHADAARREQIAQARRSRTGAEGRVNRLLELVEQGLIDPSDPALKERLETAKHDRSVAIEGVRLLEAASAAHPSAITPESITRLAASLREALGSDDPGFRNAYVRLFVGEVVVGDDEILMRGPSSR